jgi:transcriptional regulator with XRE-family HTH domain
MTSAYDTGSVPVIEVRHRLYIARDRAGLDQTELATMMGVTRSTISNAETGTGTPRRTTLNAWALACGVPVSWIINGDDPDGPNGDGPSGGQIDPADPTSGLRIRSPRRLAAA